MSLMEKLQQKEIFSEIENQIIGYLLSNRHDMDKMTINLLAANTYTSNASIIRICHKLGYSGFRDFKIAFVRELENQKLLVNTIDYSYPFNSEEPTSVVVQNMYSLFRESMNNVQAKLDIAALEKVVDTIEKSNRIFIFGVGDTKLTIRAFINKLAKINLFPVLATENGEQEYICQHITRGDCSIFVTYGGNHEDFERCAQLLRRKGATVIVLTANQECSLLRHANSFLCVPDLEKEDKIATFYSQIVFHYILNLIFSLLYRNFSR